IAEPDLSECIDHNKRALAWIRAQGNISYIIVGSLANTQVVKADGESAYRTSVNGYLDYWDRLPSTVKHLFVFRDNPRAARDVMECVLAAPKGHAGQFCAQPRSKQLKVDTAADATRAIRRDHASVIDMTNHFCDPSKCFPVIGNVLVYGDWNHMTRTFGLTLGPFVAEQVNEALDQTTEQ
ncbi:MAG: SGNH hydrolase domain-containing protein, partial [Aeromicrobium sp.]